MSKGRRVSRKPEFVKLQMRQCIHNKIYFILCKRPISRRRSMRSSLSSQLNCVCEFQGFLTMGRSIELLFISILLVNFALIQAAPCETGRSKYSISKGRCVRCKCPKGTEFSKNKVSLFLNFFKIKRI